jgi:PAS domain S-box-containing protein
MTLAPRSIDCTGANAGAPIHDGDATAAAPHSAQAPIWSRKPAWLRYSVAAALLGAALGIDVLLVAPEQYPALVFPLLIAVTAAALFGGLGPGLAVALSAVIIRSMWLHLARQSSAASPSYQIAESALFLLVGGGVSWLCASLERSRRIADRALHVALAQCGLLHHELPARRDGDARYLHLINSNIFGVGVADISGRILQANDYILTLTGMTQEDIATGKYQWPQLVPAGYEKITREAIAQLQAHGVCQPFESAIRTIDGTIVPVLLHMVLTPDKPDAFVVLVVDLTQQKRAETELRVSDARFSRLLEKLPAAAYTCDRDGLITCYNDQAVELWGRSPRLNDPTDRYCGSYKLFASDGSPMRHDECWMAKTLKTNKEFHGREVIIERSDGERATALAYSSPFHDEQGEVTGAVNVLVDISEQKVLADQLRQSQKMEAVGRLAGGVAHDFNNMLMVILNYAELALERLPSDDPLRHDLDTISDAAKRAADLTNQLLALGRRSVLAPKLHNLNVAVKDTQRLLARTIGEDIVLCTHLDPYLHNVMIDVTQLTQILMNLAVNARDAMPNGGALTIETANVELDEDYVRTHSEAAVGAYAVLSVSDTGTGMPDELRTHIFEPFFTTKPIGQGTGLGLATVYGIVKQSGGHINVYSEVGFGTTFKIYLPVAQSGASPTASSASLPKIRVGTETILLVEDEPLVRNTIVATLQRQGYRILEAADGTEALQLLDEHAAEIDLLITDLIMPRMSGRELAEFACQRVGGLPVIFMSGYTDDTVFRHGLLSSECRFLQKPFTSAVLARNLREVFDGQDSAAASTG